MGQVVQCWIFGIGKRLIADERKGSVERVEVDRAQYSKAFDEVRDDFERSVAQFGLPFESRESCPRARRHEVAAASRAHCENGDASLWRGWISPACLACRKGERTATFFVSLKCTRHCYFCFNPNQEDYEFFRSHTRDIASELRQAHVQGAQFDCLAITGGEPCLHKPEVLDFLRCAKELYPGVHVRIYTSGDLLDEGFLSQLAASGLDELRFSVKPRETDGAQDELFGRIAAAVRAIPDVMVEMPVMPGEEQEMRELLVRLDDLGVRGINLLELCFPLHNEREFQRRGFALRRNPYKVLDNYWYAGGLPIAGSEAACLDLLQFAQERELKMGVHYCSLDNKNTGQVFQQNRGFLLDDGFARAHAWLSMDGDDYFLKCAKAFGEDAERVRAWLTSGEGAQAVAKAEQVRAQKEERARATEAACAKDSGEDVSRDASGLAGSAAFIAAARGCAHFRHEAYDRVARLNREAEELIEARESFLRGLSAGERVAFEAGVPAVSFPLAWASAVVSEFPNVELAECWHVVEFDESTGPAPREVYAQAL